MKRADGKKELVDEFGRGEAIGVVSWGAGHVSRSIPSLEGP